jgi:hypothetical protein
LGKGLKKLLNFEERMLSAQNVAKFCQCEGIYPPALSN